MNIKKISLFGNFGSQNLGNECTIQAVIYNIKKYLPNAEINCICTNDEDTKNRHNVSAFLMTKRKKRKLTSKEESGRKNHIKRYLRIIFIRIPKELLEWVRAFKILKETDMLIMAGTGMLGDFGIGPFGLHYEILKWSIVAKLRLSKLIFLSVGAGPLHHPISRLFVKATLSLADYRSYRNDFSKLYLKSIGFERNKDRIYPDLAFSLPTDIMERHNYRVSQNPVVGIGLMEYFGKSCIRENGEKIYQCYKEKLVTFVAWLLENKYVVRLLIGDVLYDKQVKQDIIISLGNRGIKYEEGQIINEPVYSVEQLVEQLGKTDVVVGTRFHNILLALILNKPVVGISYHEKIDSLLDEMGLEEYCQDIENLNVDRLKEQFLKLNSDGNTRVFIKRKTEEYRNALDMQYSDIFYSLH